MSAWVKSLIAILTTQLCSLAYGGEWAIAPKISVNESYSDNVQRASSSNERSDTITEINPGISIHGEGARLKLDFDYMLQKLSYARDNNANTTNHQLQAVANAELVKRMFFLDVNSTLRQEDTSYRGRISDDNVAINNSRGETFVASVSPVFRHHFGRYADYEVRYTFDTIDNEGDVEDSDANRMNLQISSGRYFSRMPWGLSYSTNKVTSDSAADTAFEKISADVRYMINRKFSVTLNLGRDKNDYSTSLGQDNSGSSWRTGVIWTPSSRTSLAVGYGERFFGSNFYFDLSHRSKRTAWSASYKEDITTRREQQLERLLIPLEDAFGDPIIDPVTGESVEIPADRLLQTEDVQVTKSFKGSMAVAGRKNNLNVDVHHQRRAAQQRVYGGSVSIGRKLNRKSSLGLSTSWQRSESQTDHTVDTIRDVGLTYGFNLFRNVNGNLICEHVRSNEDTIENVGLTFDFRIINDVNGNLAYKHVRSDTDQANNSYKENRFSAGLTVSF